MPAIATTKRQRSIPISATQPSPIKPPRLSALAQTTREKVSERLEDAFKGFVKSASME